MYPPITFWVHIDCGLNMCPACTHQITFKMLSEMVPKYSCDMPSHTQGWSSNVPNILLHCLPCTFNVPRTSSMFPKYIHWTHPRNIFDNICGSWFECYCDYMLGTCWDHSLNIPKMQLVDTLGENDQEPTIYPRCSHWFPGHLTPSEKVLGGVVGVVIWGLLPSRDLSLSKNVKRHTWRDQRYQVRPIYWCALRSFVAHRGNTRRERGKNSVCS